MKNLSFVTAIFVLGALSSGCGASTGEKMSKMISAITGAARGSTSYQKQRQQMRNDLVATFADACTTSGSTATTTSTCTPSDFDTVGGCTFSGSITSPTFTCTLTADATTCCGDTPYTLHSGTTQTMGITLATTTSSFSMDLAFTANGTFSGDGFDRDTLVCNFTAGIGINFTTLVEAMTNANVATMTCDQQVSWMQDHLDEYMTVTMTCPDGPACTVGGEAVACDAFKQNMASGQASCSSSTSVTAL